MTQVINEGWKLQSLSINRTWGQDAHEYKGNIRFSNSKSEDISFNIPPEKMVQLLEIISDNVVTSARELGQGLVQSVQKATAQLPGADNKAF